MENLDERADALGPQPAVTLKSTASTDGKNTRPPVLSGAGFVLVDYQAPQRTPLMRARQTQFLTGDIVS